MGSNNKVMMIVIIALLVILLISVVVVSFFAINMLNSSDDPAGAVPPHAPVLTPADLYLFSLGEPIATNLRVGTDGRNHTIRVDLTVAVNNTEEAEGSEELIALIYETEPIVRDTALRVIARKTYEELRFSDGIGLLSSEILRALQEEYGTHLIAQVRVTNKIMQ